MTAEEYLAAYARRHCLDLEDLRTRVGVRPCGCGLAGCQGWEIDWEAPPALKEATDGIAH